jgi:hypothetical protein
MPIAACRRPTTQCSVNIPIDPSTPVRRRPPTNADPMSSPKTVASFAGRTAAGDHSISVAAPQTALARKIPTNLAAKPTTAFDAKWGQFLITPAYSPGWCTRASDCSSIRQACRHGAANSEREPWKELGREVSAKPLIGLAPNHARAYIALGMACLWSYRIGPSLAHFERRGRSTTISSTRSPAAPDGIDERSDLPGPIGAFLPRLAPVCRKDERSGAKLFLVERCRLTARARVTSGFGTKLRTSALQQFVRYPR